MLFSATGACSAGDTAADCTSCSTNEEMHREFAFVLIINNKKVGTRLINVNVKTLIPMMDHKNNA